MPQTERNEALRGCACPKCNSALDAAMTTDGNKAPPAKGDITICGYCGSVFRYDATMRLIVMTSAGLDAMRRGSPQLYASVARAKRVVSSNLIRRAGYC